MFINNKRGAKTDRKTWKKSAREFKQNGKGLNVNKNISHVDVGTKIDDISQDFDDITRNDNEHEDDIFRKKHQEDDEEFDTDNSLLSWRQQMKENDERVDREFGFETYTHGPPKLGWLLNMRSTSVVDDENDGRQLSGIDFYFIEEDGSTFKATTVYEPYFYVGVKKGSERETETFLRKQYSELISKIDIVEREDLDMPNHLAGLKAKYLRISFKNVKDLVTMRDAILPFVEKNRKKKKLDDAYNSSDFQEHNDDMDNDDEDETYDNAYIRYQRLQQKNRNRVLEYTDYIIDIREYDIKYHVRAAIDQDLRVGYWYDVRNVDGEVVITMRSEIVARAQPRVCAFDIETTKAPLMFPDANKDEVMMISYMIDRQGYLIVNRDIVSEDIEDFEYTPEPEYRGPFLIYNVANEKELLTKWFSHMKEAKPTIYVTYNGDNFDWPFIDTRARRNGLDVRREIGYWRDSSNGDIYRSTYGIHMDCFYWVKRDSYLPQGSHGLKAVTKAKLGYDPIEIDPEDMLPFAREQPQRLASYSVSDAVATYYLYMKYVNPFIFSLCNIIPMPADDVLRKGSGTLCETLLMAEAFRGNIICPNRYRSDPEKMFRGHLLESETYIGGHVESLRSGIFRSDIPNKFDLDARAYQSLIDNVDRALEFEISVREKISSKDEVVNLTDVRDEIVTKLSAIRDCPKRIETPMIYHLDVGAMYPNIILTNRLQPSAIVSEATCANCVHNRPESDCKRKMKWDYRAEYFKSNSGEYHTIKAQVQGESFFHGGKTLPFAELPEEEQQTIIRKRLADYTRKVYKRIYDRESITKEATVCQRETPFYVDCVRNFRDRRDELKGKVKQWKEKLKNVQSSGTASLIDEASGMVIVYESLQLAHKCILNSFYGYVMRKAARWYSMEMAGVVTYTGAQIIKMARELVERIGITLELDTDGIWCILPSSFPTNFTLRLRNGQTRTISYPCLMLNVDVHQKFSNTQYQDLMDPIKHTYTTRDSECSIFFEVDGPYRAMVLPASKEEGKGIKKRYAVFHKDGTLAELKGFEIKRRGELKLIKVFQSQVFDQFLKGGSLEECYQHVGEVANRWLDLLYTHGQGEETPQLFEYITESSSMSKRLSDYDSKQKSARITTAKRLAELFGDQMIKDKGLVCNYIVAAKPHGSPVSERVIPVSVFQKSQAECLQFLRKWLKDTSITEVSLDEIVDWNYYIERLASAIQKIITIPAALQNIENPVPRVADPDWLKRRRKQEQDSRKQMSITSMLEKAPPAQTVVDLEDTVSSQRGPVVARVTRNMDRGRKRKRSESDKENDSNYPEEVVQESYQDKMGKKKLEKVYQNPNHPLDRNFFEHEQYQVWLRTKKSQWTEARLQRRRGVRHSLTQVAGTMGSFLKQRSDLLKSSDWEILQMRESEDRPGLLKFFVMLPDQSLQTITIQVPKTIYINLRKANHANQETIKAKLPRSRPSPYLYRKNIPEDVFLERSKDLNSWLYTDPNIEGVYETQIPILFRAMMQLGAICRVNKDSYHKLDDRQQLDLTDLKPVTRSTPYLSESINNIKKIFLYQSTSRSDSRGVVAIFVNTTQRAYVYIVQPHQDQQQINLQRILREVKAQHAQSNEEDESMLSTEEESDSTSFEFEFKYVKTRQDAYQNAHAVIDSYQRERRGPTVVLAQTISTTLYELVRLVPALNEFPVVLIPSHEGDSHYASVLASWVPQLMRVVMARLLLIEQSFAECLDYCRYASLPLGNDDGGDRYMRVLDLIYGRALSQDGMVLWYSEHSRPDLGGMEEDDENALLNSTSAEELFLNGGQTKCQVNNASMYRGGFCIEFQLSHLDTDSIIQSQFVDDIEGSSSSKEVISQAFKTGSQKKQKEGDNLIVLDESIMCADSYRVLKSVVHKLFTDVYVPSSDSSSIVADSLLTSLYRWLSSPQSKLYDPALNRMVQKMMRKVFLQLLAHLRKLGARIVFADFNHILISTDKDSHVDAQHYSEYLISTLLKNKLFSWLTLTPIRYWDNLLWINDQNYIGVLTEDDANVTIFRNWNLLNYMPIEIQQHFTITIDDYLGKLYTSKQHLRQIHKNIDDKQNGENCRVVQNDADREEKSHEAAKQIITDHLTQRLLKVVSLIQKISESVVIDTQTLHLNAGAVDPALEFIKTVCHVLSMDQAVKEEVQLMRSSALKLVNIREFSREAQYRNIQQSFILPNVICTHCSTGEDLDLCHGRNKAQTMEQEQSSPGIGTIWRCTACNNAHDRHIIESRLVDYVEKKIVGYQVQDLRCIKCGSIKADNMTMRCECSGEWECKESPTQAEQNLIVLRRIAQVENFEWLSQTLQWLLST